MVIEFSAIPGAGKTYLSELLCLYLKKELADYDLIFITRKDLQEMRKEKFKNKIIRRIYILLNIIDYKIINLIFILLKRKDSLKNKIEKIIFFVNNVLNYKVIAQLCKNSNSSYIFILDEGLLHASEIFINTNNQSKNHEIDILKYLNQINSIKALNYNQIEKFYIFIESDIKENFERISKRELGWPASFRHLSDNNKLQQLLYFEQRYNRIKKFIGDRSDEFLLIDNRIFHENYNVYFSEIKKYILRTMYLNRNEEKI